MSNYIEIPATGPDSTPVLINLDKIIFIKRYNPSSNQYFLSFRFGKGKERILLIHFDSDQIRDEYYEKIRRLLINEL